MEWLIALLVFLALPAVIRIAMKSAKTKGGAGGIVLALGMAFSAFLDPPAKTSSDEIYKNKDRQRREDAGDPDDLER